MAPRPPVPVPVETSFFSRRSKPSAKPSIYAIAGECPQKGVHVLSSEPLPPNVQYLYRHPINVHPTFLTISGDFLRRKFDSIEAAIAWIDEVDRERELIASLSSTSLSSSSAPAPSSASSQPAAPSNSLATATSASLHPPKTPPHTRPRSPSANLSPSSPPGDGAGISAPPTTPDRQRRASEPTAVSDVLLRKLRLEEELRGPPPPRVPGVRGDPNFGANVAALLRRKGGITKKVDAARERAAGGGDRREAGGGGGGRAGMGTTVGGHGGRYSYSYSHVGVKRRELWYNVNSPARAKKVIELLRGAAGWRPAPEETPCPRRGERRGEEGDDMEGEEGDDMEGDLGMPGESAVEADPDGDEEMEL